MHKQDSWQQDEGTGRLYINTSKVINAHPSKVLPDNHHRVIDEPSKTQSHQQMAKRRHQLTYQSQHVVSAMAHSNVNAYQLICGTWDYGSTHDNSIEVIGLNPLVQQSNVSAPQVDSSIQKIREHTLQNQQPQIVCQMTKKGRIHCQFPASTILAAPTGSFSRYDTCQIFASASDCMQLYQIKDQESLGDLQYQVQPLITLRNTSKGQIYNEYSSPIPSFDWWQGTIATVALDSHLTLWDVGRGVVIGQVQAHQKQVFDVSFEGTGNRILTAGADSNVNLFDVRDLRNSTTLYSTTSNRPILKAIWSKNSKQTIFAVLEAYQHNILVFDTRLVKHPISQLQGHTGEINCMEWDPSGKPLLCSAGQDGNSFTWNLSGSQHSILQHFSGKYPIINVMWMGLASDWIGLSYNRQIRVIKV